MKLNSSLRRERARASSLSRVLGCFRLHSSLPGTCRLEHPAGQISRVRDDAARPWEASNRQCATDKPSAAVRHTLKFRSGPSPPKSRTAGRLGRLGLYHAAGKMRNSTHANGRPSATSRRDHSRASVKKEPHQGRSAASCREVTVNWERQLRHARGPGSVAVSFLGLRLERGTAKV